MKIVVLHFGEFMKIRLGKPEVADAHSRILDQKHDWLEPYDYAPIQTERRFVARRND